MSLITQGPDFRLKNRWRQRVRLGLEVRAWFLPGVPGYLESTYQMAVVFRVHDSGEIACLRLWNEVDGSRVPS